MSIESNREPVDPRVQIELEKLNTATDNINKFEVELDEAKCEFKKIQAESVVRMKQAAYKLGNSIDAAKPYYESRIYAAQLTKETQQAAANYEKAKSIHAAAKEMVYLAEQGLGEKSTLDTACQEMLSHAASKVNQSQLEVMDTRNSLKMCQLKLEVANNRVGKLQGQLRAAIRASSFRIRRNLLLMNSLVFELHLQILPYYETRANYNGLLKAQKVKITELEGKVSDAKLTYNEALKNLEQISEEIHRQRQQQKNLCDYEACLSSQPDLQVITAQEHHHQDRQFPCDIQSADEYLDMPETISTHSSPVRQRRPDEHDCPHLLQDFETVLTFPERRSASTLTKSSSTSASDSLIAQAQLHGPYELKSCSAGGPKSYDGASTSTGAGNDAGDEIEQWTEIRLSHSESTSSSYSNQSLLHDNSTNNVVLADDTRSHGSSSSSSSSDEPRRKVTCTTIFQDDPINKKQGLGQWLSRSNSFRVSGSRRQSLDLLIDAGDKVKDVFSLGFQRVGRSLERRSSESETQADDADVMSGAALTATANSATATSAAEFFLFSRSSEPKELLSDEQVANLLLNHHGVDENGAFLVEDLKSPPQQKHKKQRQPHQQQNPHQQQSATSIFF